jgi:hypothetical protein
MSDGITDAYRESRDWNEQWERFRKKLKDEGAEELFCKVYHIHEFAAGHWMAGPGFYTDSLDVYRNMFKEGTDLKVLFINYLDKIMEALDKDWSTKEGQYWKASDYGCHPKIRKEEKNSG